MESYEHNLTPEQKARKNIDKMLALSGRVEQNKAEVNFSASPRIAIREYPADDGAAKRLTEKKR